MESLIYKFTINGRLDGLNEYTKANRGNKYGANTLKKRNQKEVLQGVYRAKLKPIDKYPLKVKIAWYEPNLRRDIDNVTFATKFILDALVQGGYIVDDSQKYINDISHKVLVDKSNPRIEVTLETDS